MLKSRDLTADNYNCSFISRIAVKNWKLLGICFAYGTVQLYEYAVLLRTFEPCNDSLVPGPLLCYPFVRILTLVILRYLSTLLTTVRLASLLPTLLFDKRYFSNTYDQKIAAFCFNRLFLTAIEQY